MSSARPTLDRVRHELLEQAHRLAVRTQNATRLRAALLCIGVLLLTAILLVGADVLLQREEYGLRVLSAIVLTTVGGVLLIRWWLPAWRFSPSAVDVARLLERGHADCSSPLSTTIELAELDPEDDRFGSSYFRDQAMQTWIVEGYRPRWDSQVNPSFGRSALLFCSTLALLCLAACLAWPDTIWLGVKRLSLPLASAPWPRADNLRLLDPPQAAPLGAELQLEVVDDTPPFPDEVVVLVRDADTRPKPSRIVATQLGDVAVANVAVLDRDIEVAVSGGDANLSDWHRIKVVDPPDVENYEFSVTPPTYTGEPVSQIVGRRIGVLSGSRVQLTGRLSEPVQQLSIRMVGEAQPPQVGEVEAEDALEIPWAANLLEDRQTFVVGLQSQTETEWLAKESISWQFEVQATDQLMITLPDVWVIEVRQDAPPEVLLREPVLGDLGPKASLPLNGEVRDDFGIVRISAKTRIVSPAATTAKSTTGSNAVAETSADPGSESTAELSIWQTSINDSDPQDSFPKQRSINRTWSLADMLPLNEGQELAVWLEAKDNSGQIGKSREQVFRLRSLDQIVDAVQQKEKQALQRLQDLISSQKRNLDLSLRAARLLDEAQPVNQDSVDALSGVAQMQASLDRELATGEQSIRNTLEELQQVFTLNQLEDSEKAIETKAMVARLGEISESAMQPASQASYSAFQQAEQLRLDESPADEAFRRQLAVAAGAQREALDELLDVVDDMAKSESAGQVQRELEQLLNLQLQLEQTADDLRVQEISGLNKQDFSRRLGELEADQLVLARRTDDLVARMNSLVSEADSQQPRWAKMRRAMNILVEQAASLNMRDAAREIAGNKLTDASSIQQTVAKTLREASRELGLSNNAPRSLADRAAELASAAESISQLASEQAELAQQLGERDLSEVDLENLRGDQNQLRMRTEQQAEQLQDSGDFRSAEGVDTAVDAQGAAAEALQQQQADAAAESATDAARTLAEAANQAQRRADRLQSEAQQESAFQLARAIDLLVDLQRPVVTELERLSAVAQRLNELPPTAEEEIRQVAASEETARQKLQDVQRQTEQLPAFSWTLEQIDQDMSRTVAAARRLRLQPGALESARAALRKLELAAEAMIAKEPEESPEDTPPSDDPSNNQSESTPGRLVPPLASLKLLRGLQVDVNEQTQALNDRDLDPSLRNQRIAQLAAQQEALGEQLTALLRELAASTDTNQNEQPDRP